MSFRSITFGVSRAVIPTSFPIRITLPGVVPILRNWGPSYARFWRSASDSHVDALAGVPFDIPAWIVAPVRKPGVDAGLLLRILKVEVRLAAFQRNRVIGLNSHNPQGLMASRNPEARRGIITRIDKGHQTHNHQTDSSYQFHIDRCAECPPAFRLRYFGLYRNHAASGMIDWIATQRPHSIVNETSP